MKKKTKQLELVKVENFLQYNGKVEEKENTFQKLMHIYQMATKEIKTKLLKLADLDLSIKKGLKDRYIDFEIFLMTD